MMRIHLRRPVPDLLVDGACSIILVLEIGGVANLASISAMILSSIMLLPNPKFLKVWRAKRLCSSQRSPFVPMMPSPPEIKSLSS